MLVSQSTLERQVADLNEQLEQAVSAAAAAAAQGARHQPRSPAERGRLQVRAGTTSKQLS